jgi:L-iditol 2-dehydrogenase
MYCAELYEPRRFRITEANVTDPPPNEVQVAVRMVGVCGSDLHYFSEGGIGDSACVYPMVLGHEPIGEVLRTGAAVSGWSPGDQVALEPAVYCYHCEFCMSGHHNVCSNIRFHSSPTLPGFFREVLNLPVESLIGLPHGMADRTAVLHEPLSVVLHSMVFARPEAGESAVVFGAGPIGLLTIAILKLSGIRRLWAVDPVGHRRELARDLGADEAIDPAQADPVREVLRATGGRGVDVALDCAARNRTVNQCLHVTRRAGRVVLTGIPSEVEVPIAIHTMRRKEIALISPHRANRDGHRALELLAAEPERFAPIVTHVRSMAAAQSAFELLERYGDGVGKMALSV